MCLLYQIFLINIQLLYHFSSAKTRQDTLLSLYSDFFHCPFSAYLCTAIHTISPDAKIIGTRCDTLHRYFCCFRGSPYFYPARGGISGGRENFCRQDVFVIVSRRKCCCCCTQNSIGSSVGPDGYLIRCTVWNLKGYNG